MTKIYGIDLDSDYNAMAVRNAMIECFYQAHCKDTEIDQGGEELTREYCTNIVKKAFADSEGDFEHPTKANILKAMGELSEFSSNFRDDEEIKKNYVKIGKLVEKLKE